MGEDSVLGPYRLVELLGRGGMGSVFHAFDTRRERDVALKLLHPDLADGASYRARFARESRMAARLSSPHVIPIHDFGELESGQLFIDMRLCRGRDLGTLIAAEGALAPQRAVEIVSQLADALDAAHASGLVHRDVKPANTLIETSGDRDFVYLVDFGIVRSLRSEMSGSLTTTGSFLGTLPYMAPETFEDGAAVTAAIDVYALGCVLHEALTGRKAFSAGSPAGLIHQHLSTTPSRMSELRPGLPPAMDDVVARALAKQPDGRWGSAPALARAAQEALSGRAPTPMRVRWETSPPASPPPRDAVREVPGAVSAAPTRVPEAARPTSVDRPPPRSAARDARPRRPRRTRLALVGLAVVAVLGVGGGVALAVSDNSAPVASPTGSNTAPAASGPVIPTGGGTQPYTVSLAAIGPVSSDGFTHFSRTAELFADVTDSASPTVDGSCVVTIEKVFAPTEATGDAPLQGPCNTSLLISLPPGTYSLSGTVRYHGATVYSANSVYVTVDR